MTPPIIHVESDFATPDETLDEWRHARATSTTDRIAMSLIVLGIVATILLSFAAAAVIAMVAP